MAVEVLYRLIDAALMWFEWLKGAFGILVMSNYPHGKFLNSVGFALSASVRVRLQRKPGEKVYWLYTLAMILFTGYGGGIAAPMMMGKPIALVANDALLFTSILAWLLTNVMNFYEFFSLKPVNMLLTLYMAVFRANAISNTLKTCNSVLSAATPYYPTPLLGPIFLGTMSSSFGVFFPTDVGLKPIANGVPFGIQAALMSSAVYQLGVVDKDGFIGIAFRNVFGDFTDPQARIVMTLIYLQHYWLQIIFEREINIFYPLHQLLYTIIPAQGPRNLVPTDKSVDGALTPLTGKPDDAKVAVGGYPFRTLFGVEALLDVLRVAIICFSAGLFLQINRTALMSGHLVR